jgi:hypothetical protein
LGDNANELLSSALLFDGWKHRHRPAVLAAGMLGELAAGLKVGVHDAGLLVTYGALMLCIGSPGWRG